MLTTDLHEQFFSEHCSRIMNFGEKDKILK